MSRDTWAAARETIEVAALLEAITSWADDADGVTISGGEPFDQPDALLELLQGLRAAGNLSVLAYSGFTYEHLRDRHGPILSLIDVLISEPFEAARPSAPRCAGRPTSMLPVSPRTASRCGSAPKPTGASAAAGST